MIDAERTMTSPKNLARTAGVLYLLVAIGGVFAHLVVRAKVYVPGDATTTAARVAENAGLVRLGVVADLFQATVFVFLGMLLYVLLRHVHQRAAGAMMVLVALAGGIICLNMVFQFASLRVATDATYAAAFGAAGSDALVYLLLDAQHYGYLIAQIFFGLWLVPLGYLAYESGMFPRPLGVLLIVGGAGYLVDTLAQFLVPDVARRISVFVVMPSAISEFWMLGYLLFVGVRTPKVEERVPVREPAEAKTAAARGRRKARRTR